MSLWVYPILQELSFMYRGLFLLGSTLFNVGLYLIGEMYTLFLTSKHQFSIEKKIFLFINFRSQNKQNWTRQEEILD